jgi:hypothetical protein
MHDEPDTQRITPPDVSPIQIAGTFDHGSAAFPIIIEQVPEPKTTPVGQPPTREPLGGSL